jgi:nicotinamidase-related amidase
MAFIIRRIFLKSALIVIDMQNYFLSSDSPAYMHSGVNIVPNVMKIIELFKKRSMPIFFTIQANNNSKDNMMYRWWKRLPIIDTYDSTLIKQLSIYNYPIIYKKHYSIFFNTDLNRQLKEQRIENLYFTGIQTHLCVETSIRHAFMLNYESILLSDATASKRIENYNASILNLKHGFCKIISSEDVINEGI